MARARKSHMDSLRGVYVSLINYQVQIKRQNEEMLNAMKNVMFAEDGIVEERKKENKNEEKKEANVVM